MAYKIEAGGTKLTYLDNDGQAYVWEYNRSLRKHAWQKLGNPSNVRFADITYGDGRVWAVTSSGSIYRHNAASNKWDKDSKGKLVSISGHQDGSVWGVNSTGKVFQLAKGGRLGNWKEKEKPAATANWLYRVKSGDTLLKIVRAEYTSREPATTRIVNQIAALNPSKVRGVNKVITRGDVLTMPPK